MIVKIEQRHWDKGARRSLHGCAVGVAITEATGKQGDLRVVPSQGVSLDGQMIGTIGKALFDAIMRWDETGLAPRGTLYVELWPEPLNAGPQQPAEPMITLRQRPAYPAQPEQRGIAVDWPIAAKRTKA